MRVFRLRHGQSAGPEIRDDLVCIPEDADAVSQSCLH